MGQIGRTAGTATISEIARHWDVDRETAERILFSNGVPLVESNGPMRVDWHDVWSVEGRSFVASENYSAFKEPLLRVDRLGLPPEDCRRPDVYMGLVPLKPSALRARVARFQGPIIRLAKRTRRVRPCELELFLDQLHP